MRAMRQLRVARAIAAISVLIFGCASQPAYQAELAPPGTLRLGQVVSVAQHGELWEENIAILKDHGFSDAEAHSGGLAAYRVWCCKRDDTMIAVAFVRAGLMVESGDVVEVKVAAPEVAGTASFHQITRVVQKRGEDKGVRWVPADPRNPHDMDGGWWVLWARYLYAPWMEKEGWKFQGGLNKAWYKDVNRDGL